MARPSNSTMRNLKRVAVRKRSPSKKSPYSIVVALRDPSRGSSLALQKAEAIADRMRARVTLLSAFAMPYPLSDDLPASGEEVIQDALAARTKQLEDVAQPLRARGIEVDCVSVWDYPAHEAIVRHVLKAKPDLVIAESHRHGRLSRWLLANTDWELIRTCPCPLWFVKTDKLPSALSILAAVDPLHAHDKPAALDSNILSLSKHLAHQFGGRLAIVHAFHARRPESPPAHNQLHASLPWHKLERPAADARKSVKQLAERYSISGANRFLREGDPAEVLTELADEMNIDVIVMGAVSRSRLQRPFIGTTAERIIDHVKCDVLVVKPANFKSSVAAQSSSFKSMPGIRDVRRRVARKHR